MGSNNIITVIFKYHTFICLLAKTFWSLEGWMKEKNGNNKTSVPTFKSNLCHLYKLSESEQTVSLLLTYHLFEFSTHSFRHCASLLCLLEGKNGEYSIYHLHGISEPKQLDLQAHCSNFREYPIKFIPSVLCLVLVIEENIISSGSRDSL